ncbi:MAG: TIGR01777 family oxidoreductase [Thermodesulfobacteriota bacterium]
MKIFMTGGNGFVGTHLTRALTAEGHQVTLLVRKGANVPALPQEVTLLEGRSTEAGAWQESVPAHDVLVNLAGATIFRRWSPAYKQLLRDSRILTTRRLVDAITADAAPKITLLSTSAVGYYGFRQDEELDEHSPPGTDFLAKLAIDWEAEALRAREKGTRVCIMRFGVVLGRGGALPEMARPFRFFVGGPIGTGTQWFSWIHIDDLTRAARFVMEHPSIEGPANFTAPQPVTNRDLSTALGKVLGRPSFMPAPGFMIKLIMGEFGEVILNGQRVIPRLLTDAGFRFGYPDIEAALRNLLVHV